MLSMAIRTSCTPEADRDDQTLAAAAAETPGAFAVLYDRYFARVFNYVVYRIGDAQTADDIVSQVFERVLHNLRRYEPEKGPFAAWLFTITRNAVNQHLRAARRRPCLALEDVPEWAHEDPMPEEIVVDRERQVDLLAALGRLDDRQRDLIGLRFAAGLTNRRIAQLTGLTESNVAVILHRAARRLRIELEARGWQNERVDRS
jgi:RNA polymerase sigma-70 factor (ECF subfamily)